MLRVWMALGGDSRDFDVWLHSDGVTHADVWSQMLAAIKGDLMVGDTNPPPPDSLLALIWQREVER